MSLKHLPAMTELIYIGAIRVISASRFH